MWKYMAKSSIRIKIFDEGEKYLEMYPFKENNSIYQIEKGETISLKLWMVIIMIYLVIINDYCQNQEKENLSFLMIVIGLA